MQDKLFTDFDGISSKQWKNKIQADLKGADYNEKVVWNSLEGIDVKPFYHIDEHKDFLSVDTKASKFCILQRIYVQDLQKSNDRAKETLERGAESVYFILPNNNINVEQLFDNLPTEQQYYLQLLFLDEDFVRKVMRFVEQYQYKIYVLIDPIWNLCQDGNWYQDINSDFATLQRINKIHITAITINTELYQNAGANIIQQLAYGLAHLNEYLNRLENPKSKIIFQVSVGSNYFFEIAKLRALRVLVQTLLQEYGLENDCIIIAQPSKRNKSIYDYNVNMLRTTTECMSAIIGGADAVSNLAYDAIYHKDNEFGDRIARNQLLLLKNESYFDKVDNPADGSYYIESITEQLAQKALNLFKEIELSGGLIIQLIAGTIQRKIAENAQKEQDQFDLGKEVLLGVNKYPNPQDRMKGDLELYPFVKRNVRKTLIAPIIEHRLAEKLEQERLEGE
ncbi:MAG: methylmalonyl-CoA mutase subunit beta [Bacteroidota bacterium]|nr:methylmalonyl-CoA mutase subunit beta [Bacteroidota bacterium]